MAVTSRTRHGDLGLSLDDVKAMYRFMLMTRMVSERILQLNRMGRTPFGAGTDGHEAAQIGAAWNIRRGKDWTVPYYRDMGVAFVLGVTPLEEFRMVLAKATDEHSAGRQILNQFSKPQDRIVTRSVCVATEFPHAVGLALAIRNRKEENIVFAFGGDGSTSPGDFHEAANFASIHKLPVVFVIENNLLAISTRFEWQMAVRNVADKASGYGMPGFIADGMDFIDSYAKTKEAVDRVRSTANARRAQVLSLSTPHLGRRRHALPNEGRGQGVDGEGPDGSRAELSAGAGRDRGGSRHHPRGPRHRDRGRHRAGRERAGPASRGRDAPRVRGGSAAARRHPGLARGARRRRAPRDRSRGVHEQSTHGAADPHPNA